MNTKELKSVNIQTLHKYIEKLNDCVFSDKFKIDQNKLMAIIGEIIAIDSSIKDIELIQEQELKEEANELFKTVTA